MIELPFGEVNGVGLKNGESDGVQITHGEGAVLGGLMPISFFRSAETYSIHVRKVDTDFHSYTSVEYMMYFTTSKLSFLENLLKSNNTTAKKIN